MKTPASIAEQVRDAVHKLAQKPVEAAELCTDAELRDLIKWANRVLANRAPQPRSDDVVTQFKTQKTKR